MSQEKNTIKYKITCDFCGSEVGVAELPIESLAGMVVTNATLGFADVRCKPCENKNGSYSEMQELAGKAGMKHDEFKALLKQAKGKMVDFIPLLEAWSRKNNHEKPAK